MKYIKGLSIFENSQELSHEQIRFLNESCTEGRWVLNSNTGLVDVDGHFDCSFQHIPSLKGVNFGLVTGNFHCYHNYLTTLEGAPQEVGGEFDCDHNTLISLEGSPKKVGNMFLCSHNYLTSLEGAPEEIGSDFLCDDNYLSSLVGSPKKVDGNFGCNYNTLVSLEGAPEVILKQFSCDEFSLLNGEWNPRGWSKILEEGTAEAKILIITLPYLKTEYLQSEIDKNPGKWVMILREIWNLEEFKPVRDQLKVSGQFLKDIGDQSGLSDLGF